VGALQAGTKENIIPEEAELKLSVRTFDPVVNDAATKRVSEASIARFGADRGRNPGRRRDGVAFTGWS
jgi:hippurate hydrolase